MKLAKFAPIALILVLSVTAVMASHAASVTISPVEIAMGAMEDVSLNVKNNGMDNIVTVEIEIPEVDQKPVYSVYYITTPQQVFLMAGIRVRESRIWNISSSVARAYQGRHL